MDAHSFDTHVSLARVLTGSCLSISIRRSVGNRSEFVVVRSSEIFCFETVSDVVSTIASLPFWKLSFSFHGGGEGEKTRGGGGVLTLLQRRG